ncbi:hypothetical protein FKP32DRAFT_1687256 [Trametes sanguinea]|nr:hypothetical protein FKP32DRAFT_1687256 [Trametes sanguinea]
MEYLSEENSNLLLAKEWLVKADNDTSAPYLLKFYSSTIDLKCFILVTDTRNVWGEVLSNHQIARRWRDCNQQQTPDSLTADEEDEWRVKCLEFLSAVHTVGGVADLAFELVKSTYSDLALELRSDTFRWRWETFNVGPKLSSSILSKHLIMPLISMTHLSFFSTEPVGSLSEADLEKSVDRVGRIARRTADTHVKNTLSKPIVATTLRRMGAVFNFVPEPPRIVADAPVPDLKPPSPPAPSRAAPEPPLRRPASPSLALRDFLAEEEGNQPKATAGRTPPKPPVDEDSVSEEEPSELDEPPPPNHLGKEAEKNRIQRARADNNNPAGSAPSNRAAPDQPAHSTSREGSKRASPDSSSPPPLPRKKKRASSAGSSSDKDSDDEDRNRTAQARSNVRRGVKQPIKRGGKRF